MRIIDDGDSQTAAPGRYSVWHFSQSRRSMGQYFKIVNRTKRQYLEPFSMRSSEKFPSLMGAEEMTRSICWLVCTSSNPRWLELKNRNERTKRLVGSWSGDSIEIIGDYAEEDLSYHVSREYADISFEIVATLFDFDPAYLDDAITKLKESPILLEQLGMLMLLNEPPAELGHRLNTVYPTGWEREFDKICKARHRDPRNKVKNSE